MDNCFRGTEDYIAVYIDNILVFSPDINSHAVHLKKMLEICVKNGLILSPTKMKIAVEEIEFLGGVIRNSKVKLQPDIIKKVTEVKREELKTVKGLRSWLGLLNYTRSYFPNLGKLLGPFYEKIKPTGEKRMNQQDWALVEQIKQ